jgi:hypothetical protein
MSGVGLRISGAIIALALSAQAFAATPDFSPNPATAWISLRGLFRPPPSGPGPVMEDPEHPYVNGNDLRATGRQPTFPVADLSNPILQDWARDKVRQHNERVLSGKPSFSRQASCWPLGVPAFLLYSVQPVFFIQSSGKVVMIWQTDHQVRHIYLQARHSSGVKPSWFGESIGHYEGHTLVVDTVGVDTRTFIDSFETPHTDKLHVVERFHLTDDGRTMQVDVHVEDPGAFTSPWNAVQIYRRSEPPNNGKAPLNPEDFGGTSSTAEPGPLIESVCAENNVSHFGSDALPIPTAKNPDF